jgi:hypothetical protein
MWFLLIENLIIGLTHDLYALVVAPCKIVHRLKVILELERALEEVLDSSVVVWFSVGVFVGK